MREGSLLPHRLHGKEGLSINDCYVLDCLSSNAYLEQKALLGQPVQESLHPGRPRFLIGCAADQNQRDGDRRNAARAPRNRRPTPGRESISRHRFAAQVVACSGSTRWPAGANLKFF